MDNSNMASKVIPDEWRPTSDWNSHRPLLYLALDFTVNGPVMEIGCGNGSTPPMFNYCNWKRREFRSYETNEEWADKFDCTIHLPNYRSFIDLPIMNQSMIFIDCAPAEKRKELLLHLGNSADVLVIHDTEPGAEYVYRLHTTLEQFKYRCDLHIPGMPSTTAVSNKFDVSGMCGLWDEFEIV